jgi:hypothetical protein
MAKFQSPLLGYNNNVRHKNRMFHIQTEDSGVNHPHIITHLFMDGGRILKSIKRSYAEHVGSDGLSETVRRIMKEQHKSMLIALRDGEYDHLVDASMSMAPPKKAAEPASVPELAAAKVQVPPPESVRTHALAPTIPAAALALSGEQAAARQAERAQPQELTLDLEALERAAHEVPGSSPSLFHAHELPPPPKNLFTREPTTGGTYRAFEGGEQGSRPPPPIASPPDVARVKPIPRDEPGASSHRLEDMRAPPAARITAAGGLWPGRPRRADGDEGAVQDGRVDSPAGGIPRAPSESRYAPARPAAIFGPAANPPPQSIFSDELVSDKSLDEVILSYLAEDLDPSSRK